MNKQSCAEGWPLQHGREKGITNISQESKRQSRVLGWFVKDLKERGLEGIVLVI
jgi:hypothetical protein